jgi:OPT family oligopeptide transporter
MAPDRGTEPTYQSLMASRGQEDMDDAVDTVVSHRQSRNEARKFLAEHASEGQNFTVRGVLVGLAVGLVICFSNMYFGLQTGWVSSMSMPASLIGFAFFKTLSRHLDLPFTEVENVLVQTVAGSMGTMPLGCGFVGVMPALNYMLKPQEQGPLILSLWKLILWALGLCYFGVVFAVPLRRQVIIREKLKFPSGTATALMIGVLHGNEELGREGLAAPTQHQVDSDMDDAESARPLVNEDHSPNFWTAQMHPDVPQRNPESRDLKQRGSSWKTRVKLLILSFGISGLYTLSTYFFPILRNLPIFGLHLADSWLWTLNPSLAYVGQGIIMGPATTLHMLLGAVIGWGVLSPLAKYQGWAPGPVSDWESGSRGWIVWVSLAIMLADSVVSLGYLMVYSLVIPDLPYVAHIWQNVTRGNWNDLFKIAKLQTSTCYVRIDGEDERRVTVVSSPANPTQLVASQSRTSFSEERKDLPDVDAPPEHLISDRTVWIGMFLSVAFCIICIRVTFGASVPFYATVIAVLMALILSVMGVRALGETDLNPVSGISKLAQLFFALIIPQSNINSVIINLVAGAVSEAGALQAGDLMQDLKTGHLLGAAPNAQFWGQIIGSTVGAVVSALIYRLYTSVYAVPGELFQVPTGYVWIFTARLVTGKGLPDMAWQWALGAAIVFAITTSIRVAGTGASWHPYIPGGIAVAVGKLNQEVGTFGNAS